ncbi:MAG: ribonuclease III [Cyanobacteria bacterium SID2]|nr:ribonuclease III [Cyanobacteria bacterium SID2]MBP0004699.1 ribonuclease III [Cyanobacteria bacterium SBC]
MTFKIPLFKDKKLLDRAFIHRSYANEHPEASEYNERLEFLGDSVLNFISASFIYKLKPEFTEGELTRLRSKLVDEPQLAKFARCLELDRYMKLGQGAEKDGGRNNDSLLSDTFEALVGAYFLDSGIEAVRQFVEPLLESATVLSHPELSHINSKELRSTRVNQTSQPHKSFTRDRLADPKNRFQEWALKQFATPPRYKIIEESGPPHDREFTAQVLANGEVYGMGKGRRKQEAEKRAAEAALKQVMRKL